MFYVMIVMYYIMSVISYFYYFGVGVGEDLVLPDIDLYLGCTIL